MRGHTPNVVIKIEVLIQIKFRVFNLFSKKFAAKGLLGSGGIIFVCLRQDESI